jgi:adenylosuccinate synthase
VDRVLGVVKAYTTAVGAGPLPAELTDATGDRLRTVGREYGATTGRPRRCGWLDVVAVRHGAWLNGYTGIAVTKLDVLAGLPELRICVAYELDGRRIEHVPDTAELARAVPVWETLPGFAEDPSGARTWDQLPVNARTYLARIAELVEVPIELVSVGPEREQLVVLPTTPGGAG